MRSTYNTICSSFHQTSNHRMFRRPKHQLPTTSPSTFTPNLPSISPSNRNHNKYNDTADVQQSTIEMSSQRKVHHSHGPGNQNKRFLQAILLTFTVTILLQLKKYIAPSPSSNCLTKQDQTWHGGHPSSTKSGSCWCGSADGYCMCTPAVAIDIVLYSKSTDDDAGGVYDVWAVRRGDTGQLATIGG